MPIVDPLIILAPSRSYTSVVCAMLGQHPQMYDIPEAYLFTCNTMWQWWVSFGKTVYSHGLLRAISEINWGVQTEGTIDLSRWLLRRSLHREAGDMFKELAQQVYPLILVEKSPATAYHVEHMQRILYFFPRAKFLHLVRHPLGHGQSFIKVLTETLPTLPFKDFLGAVRILRGVTDFSTHPPTLNPQIEWYNAHANILSFLATVPPERHKRVRGEDLMADPDLYLREIVDWMGLRTDPESIEVMKHPERSPFACIGPQNAPLGGDPNFLRDPYLRTGTAGAQSLEGPLPWRKDGAGFTTKVRQLAKRLGYT